jgi:Eukaryotic cytochrome b561
MPLTFESIWQWLLTPLSGASHHHIDDWVMWHARLMVAAWAVLLPLGALSARYFKVTAKQNWPQHVDNRAWWHAHRTLQYVGVFVMLIGAAMMWGRGSYAPTANALHGYLGWIVITLGALQVLAAWLRGSKGGPTEPNMRGDHYDMTRHRVWFERIHKFGGWLAVFLAIATIVLGLIIADAPRWMVVTLTLWWLLLIVAGIRLQRAGRCIDTYQAIWGPNPKHPGNHRKPTGWGVRRPLEAKQEGR